MHARYRKLLAKGKTKQKVVTAVGRELLGFIWAIGVQVKAMMAAPRSCDAAPIVNVTSTPAALGNCQCCSVVRGKWALSTPSVRSGASTMGYRQDGKRLERRRGLLRGEGKDRMRARRELRMPLARYRPAWPVP